MKVRYLGQEVELEYETEGSYTPTTYSPYHGADGGDFPVFMVTSATDNLGRDMLFTQHTRERWEELIAENWVPEDDDPDWESWAEY